MVKVCICQICNCGRHKCPHNPRGAVQKGPQPCTLSEYTTRYRQHPLEMRQPFKPEQGPKANTGPMDDATTNRVDYIKHPLDKPYVRQGDVYKQPDGNMEDMTNYKKDYTKKPIQQTKPVRQDMTRKLPGKFEGDPTYKTDYREWGLTPRREIRHDPDYRPPSAPFEGASNYHTDYIAKKQPVRASMKPAENTNASDQPIQDNTDYRDSYKRHPLPPKELKEQPKWEGNQAPLDGLSNYKKDYVQKSAPMVPSCKPEGNAYKSAQPFDGDTTQRIDYKKWPMEKPWVRDPQLWVQPPGDMDMNTTSHTHYTPKPINRAVQKRPDSRKKLPGKFDGTTNYHEDYKKWGMGERPMQTMKSEYAPPTAAFEGMPTYKSDYIARRAPPRQSMKPAENSKASDQPFDGRTGYRDDFVKHPIDRKQPKKKKVPTATLR